MMRDGVVLRADIYRLSTGGPWPVLLTRLPYGKNMARFIGMLDPIAAARRGFIVVLQDTRGRFASDGEWEMATSEADDGYDTVRWAALLPHSNGSVGMYGTSYFAYTQWVAALGKPPELKAISPRMVWSDPQDGLLSRGGAYELGFAVPWSLNQGIELLARRQARDPAALDQALASLVVDMDAVAREAYWELPTAQHPVFERHDIPEPGFQRLRRDPAWRRVLTIAAKQADVDLPTLHTGGWYDVFCQGTLDNFTAAKAVGRRPLALHPRRRIHHRYLASPIRGRGDRRLDPPASPRGDPCRRCCPAGRGVRTTCHGVSPHGLGQYVRRHFEVQPVPLRVS